jgi:hypothetical protein
MVKAVQLYKAPAEEGMAQAQYNLGRYGAIYFVKSTSSIFYRTRCLIAFL